MIVHDDKWPDIAVDEEWLSDESKEFINNFLSTEKIDGKYSILQSIEEEPDLEKNRIVSPHFEKFKRILKDWLILYPIPLLSISFPKIKLILSLCLCSSTFSNK